MEEGSSESSMGGSDCWGSMERARSGNPNSIELDCGCWVVVSGGWMFGGEWKKRRLLSLSLSQWVEVLTGER